MVVVAVSMQLVCTVRDSTMVPLVTVVGRKGVTVSGAEPEAVRLKELELVTG